GPLAVAAVVDAHGPALGREGTCGRSADSPGGPRDQGAAGRPGVRVIRLRPDTGRAVARPRTTHAVPSHSRMPAPQASPAPKAEGGGGAGGPRGERAPARARGGRVGVGGRGGVAVWGGPVEAGGGGRAEPLSNRRDDPRVGLVVDEEVDLIQSQPRVRDDLLR